MAIRLSEWAEKNSISYDTAWRWKRDGKIPYLVEKIGGIIFVHEDLEKLTCTKLQCPRCGEILEVELR